MKQIYAVLFLLLVLAVSPVQATPAIVTLTVNSTLDQIDDDTSDGVCHTASGTCTLRAAIMQANHTTGEGTDIILPAGLYNLTRPISGLDGPDNGDLNLTTPNSGNPVINIIGAGAANTIIDGQGIDRVIFVDTGRTASISGVTIRNGFRATSDGGGIRNYGTLNVSYSTISDNKARWGAGIANFEGILDVSYSTISGNISEYHGGGIFNIGTPDTPSLFLTNTTVSQNSASGTGGGIVNNMGLVNIYNSTIALNTADADHDNNGEAGGIYTYGGGVFNVRNTLIALNIGQHPLFYEDCNGTINSYGRNLIGDTYGCTINTVIGDWGYFTPLGSLGPLQDNGGPTLTHALLPGSSAIDAGDPLQGCVDAHSVVIDTDQRGLPRSVDGDNDGSAWCDIGAFEYDPTVEPVFQQIYLPLMRR